MGGNQKLSRYDCVQKIVEQLETKNSSEIILNKTKLSNFKTLDKTVLNLTMNTNKLNKKIKIKMTKFENVAKKIILENQINEKLSKRR